jgi:hypothetical protein
MHWFLLKEDVGPEIRHIKGKHNLIADALSRIELDDSSKESNFEKPTAQCMAAIISRTEIMNDELSTIDGFEMAEAFGIKSKKKTVEWKPLPNRKNDVVMMDALNETEEFTETELKEINRCRIYLCVFYISDIASHDGQRIAEWARKRRLNVGRKSSWALPVQQRPTSWKAWKLALDHLAPDNCVIPQLGDWFEHHHKKS